MDASLEAMQAEADHITKAAEAWAKEASPNVKRKLMQVAMLAAIAEDTIRESRMFLEHEEELRAAGK